MIKLTLKMVAEDELVQSILRDVLQAQAAGKVLWVETRTQEVGGE